MIGPAGTNCHATAVALGETGILIRGAARSGKSALALSLLRRAEAAGLPAALVADDQVLLRRSGAGLLAEAPATIRGLIEVSGVGILAEPVRDRAAIGLLVELREPQDIPRLPEDETEAVMGVPLRRIFLPAREAAFAADVVLTLLARPARA